MSPPPPLPPPPQQQQQNTTKLNAYMYIVMKTVKGYDGSEILSILTVQEATMMITSVPVK